MAVVGYASFFFFCFLRLYIGLGQFDCRQVSSNDYPAVDTLTKSIVKEKQPFVRLEMTKEDLLEMFKVK